LISLCTESEKYVMIAKAVKIRSPQSKSVKTKTSSSKPANSFDNLVEGLMLADPMPHPEPLLLRADKLINGDRQKDYGDKLQNFSQIAMIWQGILATKLRKTFEISPEDVALCMIAVKMARLAKSPDHNDSILDVAGYAGCYDMLQEERKLYGSDELHGATRDSRGL
jgi:hypothetical protein